MMKTKILIVDDYKENIVALGELIAADDVDVHSALNADHALELITQHEFGLALLDVQMPVVSGFDLAKIIRGVKKFRSLPIIFVTAHQQDSAVVFEGYESGAVDLLFKPLEPNMVRAKVRIFVELAQQRQLLQSHVRELERLRLEAEAANIAKSQFLANMSHEIRTPLAAVMGFAELIARGTSTAAETEECIDAVRRNGKLLLRLIDDILDLSKIEANRLELEQTDFDLDEVLHDIQSTLSFRAQERGITLKFDAQNAKGGPYKSDPTRLKQVLLNIIGNGIKFTSAGTVEVTAAIEPENSDSLRHGSHDRLIVRIKDQGVGLTADQAERLFQPFGQADASTRRQFGGSGLGLVISRQIARAMGGNIRLVESKPGTGSTFEILLLLEKTTGAELEVRKKAALESGTRNHESEENRSLQGKKILAVDDSPDNLTLISMFLRDSGALLSYADSGNGAIGEVKKENFDIILMDVQMPGMDGHQATEEIRRLGFKKPIIALTAHAIRSEHEKCRRSGCDAVLTKPITRANLLKGLYEYAR
ncbi:hypothetical protein BH10BDE1_BH10BDE1_14640 [soil metagenome]